MKSDYAQVQNLNKVIYIDLDKVLKNLNKKFHLKMYAVVLNGKGKYKTCFRIKKTLPESLKNEYQVIQDELLSIDNIFKELNVPNKFIGKENEFSKNIKEYLDKREFISSNNLALEEIAAVRENENGSTYKHESDSLRIEDSTLLYSNTFKLSTDSGVHKIIYILEIRNVDIQTINVFYNRPVCSFIRITLDYFFIEHYLSKDDKLQFNESGKISKKNNENSLNFTRRMSRIFYGKIRDILMKNDIKRHGLKKHDNVVNGDYYINNLIEEIDDISSKTYEGASPFGSILFLTRDCLEESNIKVKYAIKFRKEDRVPLCDSKKVRKLLEMANEQEGLYLIANYEQIFGLGEVMWNELGSSVLFRLDFKGLSKYNLVCVYTEENLYTEGRVIIEDDRKTYKCNKNLEIIEDNLISILFKNPKIKEEEYTSEKFKKVFKSIFFDDRLEDAGCLSEANVEKLEKIVRRVRGQKHGTMVVITDADTASNELKALRKQSTLIERMDIEPKHIKYLTSIDGAIYFDIYGKCHAIGVILDGVAHEDIGDAGRGARYNSAHRYLKKLKDNGKKCIIVIISEDGMVDIIPEIDNEEKIYNLAQEIIDLINEKNTRENEILDEKEAELEQYRSIDYDIYFLIANTYYAKKEYEKAIGYYKKGISAAGNNFVASEYFNNKGNCHHWLKDETNYKEAISCYEMAIKYCNDQYDIRRYYQNMGSTSVGLGENYYTENNGEARAYIEKALECSEICFRITRECNYEMKDGYFNTRGRAYFGLARLENDSGLKKEFYQKAIDDYSSAMKIREDRAYYWNRGLSYMESEMYEESIEDFINAIIKSSEDKRPVEQIKVILSKRMVLSKMAFELYDKKCEETKTPRNSELVNLLQSSIAKLNNNGDISAK